MSEGTKIIVFYPKNGVSPIQEKQMVTQKGDNTYVVGIHGNFDQAQTGVKKMFHDTELAAADGCCGLPVLIRKLHQYRTSGSSDRLLCICIRKTAARTARSQEDEKINVVVPTGNFGNILAAYLCKEYGTFRSAKLICASNENKVLFDFFRTGTYDKNREFMLTSSPSMDILISSNLERLIYRIAGDDAESNP